MKPPRRTRPSLFDIQVNGFAGVDFQDPRMTAAGLRRACRALKRHHTHRFLLTLTTDTIAALEEKFAHVESLRRNDPLAREMVPGYHLEGPFMSPEPGYCGAHFARIMRPPNLREFERLQNAAGGNIRLVTIAPEWPGSPRFIEAVVRTGSWSPSGTPPPAPRTSSARSRPERGFAPTWATPAPPCCPGTTTSSSGCSPGTSWSPASSRTDFIFRPAR